MNLYRVDKWVSDLKLLKIKKWLTLNDASRYLSLKFEEEVTLEDVLQLVTDGHLNLSWLLNNRKVVKIKRGCFLYLNKPDTIIYAQTGNVPTQFEKYMKASSEKPILEIFPYYGGLLSIEHELAHQSYIIETTKPVSDIENVSGAYKFDINSGGINETIIGWLTGNEEEWFAIDGFVLESDTGELLRPVDMMDCNGALKKYSVENSYPTDEKPNLRDLVIRKADLDKFENAVDDSSPGKSLSSAAENSYLKIMGALVNLLKTDRTRKYTQEAIQDELEETYGRKLEIKSFSKSNLQKIFSSAKKALENK